MLGAGGFAETALVEDADLVILNTCHIRERATEKIFSELGKLRLLKAERTAAGRDTQIVVAGCVAQAEGAEILRRERAVDVVVGPQSYHRLPDMLARAGQGSRVVDTEFELEGKFARLPLPSASQVRARGPSAFLTIQEGLRQVLHLLRRALHAGPRAVAAGGAARRRGPRAGRGGRARDHAARAERQRLPRRGRAWAPRQPRRTMPASRRDPRSGAPAVHDKPPERPRRRPRRSPSRPAGADAVPAPAGAVGLGQNPQGDEPQAHARPLFPPDRKAARRARRSRAVIRLHRRLPRRDRGRLRGDARPHPRRRLRLDLLVQIFAAPRHARRRHGGPGAGRRDARAPRAAAGAGRGAAPGLQRRHRRPHAGRAARAARAAIRARSPARPPTCSRCRSTDRHISSVPSCPCGSLRLAPNSLFGILAEHETRSVA